MKQSNQKINMDPGKIQAEMENSTDSLIRNYILKNCISGSQPMKQFINHIESEMIHRALRISAGNQRVASFILGVKPTTLNEKIRKYNIKGFKRPHKHEDMKELVRKLVRTSPLF